MNSEFETKDSPGSDPKDEQTFGSSPAETQPLASPEPPFTTPPGEATQTEGWVAQPEMAGEPPYSGDEVIPPSPPAVPPRRKALPLVIGGLVVLLVAIGVVVAAILLTRKDTAIAAVPADAPLYVGVNLLELTPQKMDRLIKPLLGDTTTADFNDADSMFTNLESTMLRDYGVSFKEDVRSWLGQYIGISLGGDFSDLMQSSDTLFFTVIAETRNKSAADAFLEKLRLGLEEKQGYIFDTQDYQGITVYASPEYDLAFARSKGLVLFSNQVEGIQTAIDTQQGESLAKNADYQRLIKQLPGKRAVTFYVGGEQYMQLLSQMGGSGLTGGASLMGSNQLSAAAKGFAGSLAITDDGLRMDVLALHDPEKMTEAYRTYLANASQTARVAEVLPAETMLMFAGYGLNDYMRLVEESMSEEIAADYADSMQMLEQELGFSLKADLLAYLDQEYGMAVLPDKEGILSTLTSLPLNLLLFTHHNNQDMLAVTMEKLSVKVEEMGLTVTPSDEGENHYYIAGDPYSGDILTAGLGKAYLALSLSRTAVDSVLNPIETLAGKAEYQEVWSHFPKGITPNLYFEFANLVFYLKENVPELASDSSNDVWSVLEAIPHIVSGNLPVKDDTAHSITIIFVESLPEE